MLCSIATKLKESDLSEITALENDLGATVLAFACHPLDAAELGAEQLARIKAVEDKLGVALVAVRRVA
jgi:hypothetical protein